jgi:hypothetical protein
LGFDGVTVMLLKVGLTKKPRQLARADTKTTVQTVENTEFRLELNIIANPRRSPSADDWPGGVLAIVAERISPS